MKLSVVVPCYNEEKNIPLLLDKLSQAIDRDDIDDETLQNVLKQSALDEFIESLPAGLETVIGERGIKLSGGQRQRLVIARALVRQAPIMIFDEATSSLDSENEQLVQQALERLMKGRTTMIIAHRLSTVKHADLVIVLEEGQITQSGTHQSLVSSPGLYQSLVEHQVLEG